MPEALIWGAAGGMGQALVNQLNNAGWRVFAASRDVEAIPAGVDERVPSPGTRASACFGRRIEGQRRIVRRDDDRRQLAGSET